MVTRIVGIIGWVALLAIAPARGQSDVSTGLDVFPNLQLGDLGKDEGAEPATFAASYAAVSDTEGVLTVEAKLSGDWHVYSTTQAAGGPTPTKIKVMGPAGVEVTGPFKADRPPLITSNQAWPGLKIEEHGGLVRWQAPVRFPAGFRGEIQVAVTALACLTDGSCIPQNPKLKAAHVEGAARVEGAAKGMAKDGGKPAAIEVREEIDPAEGATPFRDKRYVVEWVGKVVPAKVAPGGRAVLELTAKPDATFHVYAAAVDDTESRTNFVITEKGGLKFGPPKPPSDPIIKEMGAGLPAAHYHEGEVTWSIPIEIPADAAPGEKLLRGVIAYQACTDTSCQQPKALKFVARVDVDPAAKGPAYAQAVRFATSPLGAAKDAAAETKWVDPLAINDGAGGSLPIVSQVDSPQGTSGGATRGADERGERQAAVPLSLALVMLMAVGGGLILNLMPCVLPVVGLKIMSFASQAGENRGKVLALNLAYTLGILVVFWALAGLAIFSTYSAGQKLLGVEGQLVWGQQFQYFGFRFPVTIVVFALALSFLGVWEIPLPGFVGGRSSQDLQKKEGFSGAFFKGIFTTVLATPCSGPLLGAVFAYTLGKSALVILAIFTAIGLGMALPYLLIALFPPLIAFLPKPGGWMDILKQILGFLLLATVVYLFSLFPDPERVPVFMSLIGVWFGCWLIGLVPNWQELPRRLAAWGAGIASAAAVAYLAFSMAGGGKEVVAWEPYNESRLTQLREEGKTVLIDFTAKWCLTCQLNYKVAINTESTGELVNKLGAVAMLADWTDHSEEIREKLQELQSNAIPLLAIYPGAAPDKPIVLRDLVTQGDVLEALRKAGPSVSKGANASSRQRGDSAIAVTR